MNELETYVASLQDQGLGKEEIKAKVKAWKLANEPLVEKEEKDPPSKFKDDGSLNTEAFSDETKDIAIKANEASKKENDSAKAIPVVESEENTESTSVDSTSESYFTKRGDETIFDLEAFGTEFTRNIERKVNLGEAKVGFSLLATRIEDVIDFADQKLTMPPKSTWFDPKPLDGLVAYDFE